MFYCAIVENSRQYMTWQLCSGCQSLLHFLILSLLPSIALSSILFTLHLVLIEPPVTPCIKFLAIMSTYFSGIASYWVKDTSMYTSSGIFSLISCLIDRSSAPKSMTLLWTRISYLSYVLVPCPHGDFLVTIFIFFVGKGCGPFSFIPFFSPIPLISEHTPSRVERLVDVSFIRASCANFFYSSYSDSI
jgi:hypothetical protein